MTTLLAADVGNTNVVLGAYDGAKLISTWRTATCQDQTEDELAVMVDALLGREDLSLDDVDALVLGSVVPPLTASFTRLAERYLDRPALVIGPGVKTGVRLRVEGIQEPPQLIDTVDGGDHEVERWKLVVHHAVR